MKIRLLALLALYVVAVPAMARESLAERTGNPRDGH
jgi:hypothetical protein